ncbi:MAG TPA: RNA polymerase sigma factor [Bryobacteraceae bacterium]|nr:RNA polymerase sigma factor [Bryobacteraceae bacterium]
MTEPANLADDDLAQLMASGDDQAFTALYRRRQGAVYRFALQMSGNPSIAEEVTQEVFMSLLRDPGGYDSGRGPLTSYLYGIARNLVWRRLAQSKGHVPISAEGEDDMRAPDSLIVPAEVERDLVRDEAAQSVRRAILGLPPGYREAVVLCDLHELSYEDAARVLGCAVGTVRSRLHRARALLSERLTARRRRSKGCLV